MMPCDSWCEHVECNKIRKNCMHPIEDRQFVDWEEKNNTLLVFGKCQKCLLYVTLTITRKKSYQKLHSKLPKLTEVAD